MHCQHEFELYVSFSISLKIFLNSISSAYFSVIFFGVYNLLLISLLVKLISEALVDQFQIPECTT